MAFRECRDWRWWLMPFMTGNMVFAEVHPFLCCGGRDVGCIGVVAALILPVVNIGHQPHGRHKLRLLLLTSGTRALPRLFIHRTLPTRAARKERASPRPHLEVSRMDLAESLPRRKTIKMSDQLRAGGWSAGIQMNTRFTISILTAAAHNGSTRQKYKRRTQVLSFGGSGFASCTCCKKRCGEKMCLGRQESHSRYCL